MAENLTNISNKEYESLFPISEMSEIIENELEVQVLKEESELKACELLSYNTCVFVDAHLRFKDVPESRHPLLYKLETLHTNTSFREEIGTEHNQVCILVKSETHTVATLHIAGIYGDTLFINYIELLNPNIEASKPMDIEQNYTGIGNGVFSRVIDGLCLFGEKNGYQRVSCHAIDHLRADFFIRKAGFSLDRSDEFLFSSSEINGRQIPLERIIR